MATTLPVLQAVQAMTFTPSGTWGSYVSIPYTSFTVGHRYLIFSYCELMSQGVYGGSDYTVRASVRYNGVELPQINHPYNQDASGRFLSCQTHERYLIPAGAGGGLQLGAYSPATIGGQIRNLRLVAIDLDVNNTDFPQQSSNGWLWAEEDGSQGPSTSWETFIATPWFTPDEGDYLVIASGTFHPLASENPVAYLAVGINGTPTSADVYQISGTAYGHNDYVTLISPKVVHLTNVYTSISMMARVSAGTLTYITGSHVLVLRLNTFTKQAGASGNPPYTTGLSWQSAVSVTPSPASIASDQFLIFSHIRAQTWVSELGTISERVLRNPGAAQAVIGTSCWHRYTAENHGPFLCILNTADGANSYELQFKRDAITNEPANFYQHTLAALKTEVTYVNIDDVAASSSITTTATTTATTSGGVNVEVMAPQNNAEGLPLNTEIVFRAYINIPVVDLANVNVYQTLPSYIPVMVAGEFMPGWSGEIIENIASQDYTIVIIPPTAFDSGVRVHFLMEYEDL